MQTSVIRFALRGALMLALVVGVPVGVALGADVPAREFRIGLLDLGRATMTDLPQAVARALHELG